VKRRKPLPPAIASGGSHFPMNITEFLGKQHKGVLIAIGTFLLAAGAVGDNVTSPEFESSIFFLVPVSFFAWFINRETGLIAAGISAAITLVTHRTATSSTILYWNVFAWLALYIFLVWMIAELRSLYERERHSSRTDALTKIPNRRAFFEVLETEKNRAQRYGSPLTLAYLDLDNFKAMNDRFGHTRGDHLLRVVAKTMQKNVRQVDMVARMGGDEFAVLLPETTEDSAAAVLQKLHTLLDSAMRQRKWPVTFSMGAVTFQPPPDSTQEMISKADEVMYAAKTSGRDRVIVPKAAT
jgi:diguanylate cyclase (GGDEF)-like protein